MELTKNKLNSIIKKYRSKLDQHEKEWKEICSKLPKTKIEGDKLVFTTPSIYDHEKHNSKAAKLFKEMVKEFDGYEVFTNKTKS